MLEWVRHAHATTRFTTSVCTGSLVLGAAGLLDGLTATTHWACYDELAAHGALPTAERVVEHLEASASSRRPGCRAASTWRCAWSSCWWTRRRPRRPS